MRQAHPAAGQRRNDRERPVIAGGLERAPERRPPAMRWKSRSPDLHLADLNSRVLNRPSISPKCFRLGERTIRAPGERTIRAPGDVDPLNRRRRAPAAIIMGLRRDPKMPASGA
jgi:hypothetical protein